VFCFVLFGTLVVSGSGPLLTFNAILALSKKKKNFESRFRIIFYPNINSRHGIDV